MSERKTPASMHAGTLAMGAALDSSVPLARLMQRLRESNERFACISDSLPPDLRQQVRPGPLDDEGWSLLVSSGAVAAKLRQLVPALDTALRTAGWQGTSIRIKVQSA